MRWRSAVVAGGLAGLVALGISAVYLASIEIDDGLESLIVVPLLGLAMVGTGAFGSWRRAGSVWVVEAAATSLVPLMALLTWSVVVAAREERTGSSIDTNVPLLVAFAGISAAATVFGLACVAGLVGWGAGEGVRWVSARRRRRADGPA